MIHKKTLTENEMREFHAENASELLNLWGFDPTREIVVVQNRAENTMIISQKNDDD